MSLLHRRRAVIGSDIEPPLVLLQLFRIAARIRSFTLAARARAGSHVCSFAIVHSCFAASDMPIAARAVVDA